MHVLILGARAPVCLEWARAFGHSGWQVTVADSLAFPLTRFSRSTQRFAHLPEPRRDPATWLDALLKLVIDTKVDLLLPTCEEAFYLASGRERLEAHCRVMTADFATLHRLHHKGRFAQMTSGWPAEAPQSQLLSTTADLTRFAADSSSWVFKPAYSRFAHQTLIRPDASALRALQPTPEKPWVAQRFVAGREHCSYSLLVGGRLTAHACYHPRYRVGRGSGIYFEPTDPRPVRDFLVRFGAVTGYTGQVGFDFIESADGRVHVLECNPRGTSGIHLFADQPEALVHALLGSTPGEVLLPTMKPRMVALAMLLFAAPRHGLSPDFWRAFRNAPDVVVAANDLGPLLAQIPGLIEITCRALQRRCGLLAAATHDIEWDGQSLDASRP
jgi:hypothetical protein